MKDRTEEDNTVTPLREPGFSEVALRKAVLSKSLSHPLTIYPAATSVIGVSWLFLIEPALLAFLVAIGGASLGVGSWIVNYFFRWDSHANEHLADLSITMRKYREQSTIEIKKGLLKCKSMAGVEKGAEKGLKQFEEINTKFDLLREILRKKLNQQEVTYARFLATAEQVYLNTLDNLRDLVNFLKGTAVIGSDYMEEIIRLQQIENPSSADQKQLTTLLERDSLKDSQQERIDELIAVNEKALTKIDATIAAFSKTRIRKGRADVNFETAISELEALASRLQEYSITR